MACMDGLFSSMFRIISGLFISESIIGELMICCISSGFRMSCSCILFMSPKPPSWLTMEFRSARPEEAVAGGRSSDVAVITIPSMPRQWLRSRRLETRAQGTGHRGDQRGM